MTEKSYGFCCGYLFQSYTTYRGGNIIFEGLLYQFYVYHDNTFKLMSACFTVIQYLIFLLSISSLRGLFFKLYSPPFNEEFCLKIVGNFFLKSLKRKYLDFLKCMVNKI